MPPTLALSIWLVLLLLLFYFDPGKVQGTSPALWVPVIWITIVASRLPSQWFGYQAGSEAQALESGNPLDRLVFLLLILLSVGILASRRFRWSAFVSQNAMLIAFLAFALLSVLWSDFAFVSLKRWFRDLGNYLVILVILSDPRPLEAARTVLRRVGYLLVPLSIILIKYYPAIGKQYSEWSGENYFVGVGTSKNMLGAICLFSGIVFLWDVVSRWPERRDRRVRRTILVDLAFIGMTLWLTNLAKSATSEVGLAIGSFVILISGSKAFKRHPGFFKTLVVSMFPLYLILAFGFNLSGDFAGAVGRNPTLTGRTLIWQAVLSLDKSPLVGVGYASFWLGPRLLQVWKVVRGINEAHNGYLEIYLDLGLIGVALLLGFLISGYRNISRELANGSPLAPLKLALWTTALFYNMTESAFKFHLLWIALLLSVLAVPSRVDEKAVAPSFVGNRAQLQRVPLKAASFRR